MRLVILMFNCFYLFSVLGKLNSPVEYGATGT